jgi:hypothetical protein
MMFLFVPGGQTPFSFSQSKSGLVAYKDETGLHPDVWRRTQSLTVPIWGAARKKRYD